MSWPSKDVRMLSVLSGTQRPNLTSRLVKQRWLHALWRILDLLMSSSIFCLFSLYENGNYKRPFVAACMQKSWCQKITLLTFNDATGCYAELHRRQSCFLLEKSDFVILVCFLGGSRQFMLMYAFITLRSPIIFHKTARRTNVKLKHSISFKEQWVMSPVHPCRLLDTKPFLLFVR